MLDLFAPPCTECGPVRRERPIREAQSERVENNVTKSMKRFLAGGAIVVFGALGLGGCFGGSDGCPTVYSCGYKNGPA